MCCFYLFAFFYKLAIWICSIWKLAILHLYYSACVLDRDTHGLHLTIIEYIDGARICLETEADKESLRDIKLHFCNFIKKMIESFPCKYYSLFPACDISWYMYFLASRRFHFRLYFT